MGPPTVGHALPIGTRKKFASLQLRLSSHDTRPSFRTDRMDRTAVQTILADLMPTSYTIHHNVRRNPDLEYLFMVIELILHCNRLTYESQTIRLTPFPHKSRTRLSSRTCSSRHTEILCFLCKRGESFSKAKLFAPNRPSLFPSLPRCSLQALSALQPRLLHTTAAATTIAHPNDARGLHHVSWPLPVRRVRFTHTFKRHPIFPTIALRTLRA